MNFVISVTFIFSALIFGYLLGSISNGLLISKIFFHKDIREVGSKNVGGTNVGRVLGKKYGALVIALDALKCLSAVWITYFSLKYLLKIDLFMDSTYYAYIAGLGACIGHTFPLFASFKGGKVVACYTGLVISLNWGLALLGAIIYFIILKISKYVSLTSIITTIIVALLSFIPLWKYTSNFNMSHNLFTGIYLLIISLWILIRHKDNIKRLKNKEEKKISWMK